MAIALKANNILSVIHITQTLDLRVNSIGDIGVKSIGDALKVNSGLTVKHITRHSTYMEI